MNDLAVRAYRSEDEDFVYRSWLSSYAETREIQTYVRNVLRGRSGDFKDQYRPVVAEILARSTVMVAVLKEDDSAAVGWACVEQPDIVHYAFVKPRWRRLGVLRMLLGGLEEAEVTITHTSPMASKLTLPTSWTYRPSFRWSHDATGAFAAQERPIV